MSNVHSPSSIGKRLAFISTVLFCMMGTSAQSAETAPTTSKAALIYQQCRNKNTTAEQRDCYPAAIRQSEVELKAAEKKERASMADLEAMSPGSAEMHPVRAFDEAARAFRAFRDAESQRVLASYGSGNGGGLAASETVIRMNLDRIKLLSSETAESTR